MDQSVNGNGFGAREDQVVRHSDQLFRSEWLNHGLDEARRLKRLRKIEQKVSEFLADQFRGELDSQQKQQVLFSLLGIGFVQKHFPHHKYDPSYLQYMDHGKKEVLLKEMRQFIEDKVATGLQHYKKHNDEDKKLIGNINEIFKADLKAEIEKQLMKEKKIKLKPTGRRGKTMKVVELEDTMPDRVKFIENTLKDFLENCPSVTEEVMVKELTHRVIILPPVLRHKMFDMYYLNNFVQRGELGRKKTGYSEWVLKNLKKHKLTNVSDWEGRKAVDLSVILAYERSPSLKSEFEANDHIDHDEDGIDDRLVFYTRILTIAKLCDNNFSPTHIFWLIRAVNYFPKLDPLVEKEDRALHLAFMFERFSRIALFDHMEVFEIAQETYDILEQAETEVLIKINDAVARHLSSVDPTLFPQNIIHTSQAMEKEVLKRFLSKKRLAEQDYEIFADFKLFLRKWISEAFVGTLNKHGVSLIWDFLFLNKFSSKMTVKVCLMLFNLLKPLLLDVQTFREVQHTMFEGPKVILIRDLRRILQHFAKGGNYETIPDPPNVPSLQITPPSARADRKSMEKRMETLSLGISED